MLGWGLLPRAQFLDEGVVFSGAASPPGGFTLGQPRHTLTISLPCACVSSMRSPTYL